MKGWANLCTQIIHKSIIGKETSDEIKNMKWSFCM